MIKVKIISCPKCGWPIPVRKTDKQVTCPKCSNIIPTLGKGAQS